MYIGDESSYPVMWDYFVNHDKDPVIKQQGFNGKLEVFFFVAHMYIKMYESAEIPFTTGAQLAAS